MRPLRQHRPRTAAPPSLLAAALLAACAGAVAPGGRQGGDRPEAAAAPRLLAPGWQAENREALELWLARLGARAPTGPRVAVFDWDDTSIVGDVQTAVFRHQLDALALRLEPDELREHLAPARAEPPLVFDGVELAAVAEDLLDSYAELWPLLRTGRLEQARGLRAHADFRARAGWLYDGLEHHEGAGPRVAYPWLAGWMGGHTDAEARELVGRALEAAAAEGPGEGRWSAEGEGRSGRLSFSFRTGLCALGEIRELMAALERVGVGVHVVSASSELAVEVAAARLGYPLGPERIFGIRLETASGRLSFRAVEPARYAVPWREGKVSIIRQHLPAPPLFVAGDADTDYEMLTGFPETEVRLVVNRNRAGDIASLYAAALADPPPGGPTTLLQGRDEPACSFHPMRESIELGRREPTPLAAPR